VILTKKQNCNGNATAAGWAVHFPSTTRERLPASGAAFSECDSIAGTIEEQVMFAWLKKRLNRQSREQRSKEHFDKAEGSYVERAAIVGLMMAVEAEEVAVERQPLKQADQFAFMMAYECCLMWAIKVGAEKIYNAERTRSLVMAMQKHLARHAWYQAGAFEKIWERVEVMMPFAMNASGDPNAPPPYPVAELQMALDQAGYHLSQPVGMDFKFGMYMFLMMRELTKAATAVAEENPGG
jgi:hypothetical protein